jgi:hypothetical protein
MRFYWQNRLYHVPVLWPSEFSPTFEKVGETRPWCQSIPICRNVSVVTMTTHPAFGADFWNAGA